MGDRVDFLFARGDVEFGEDRLDHPEGGADGELEVDVLADQAGLRVGGVDVDDPSQQGIVGSFVGLLPTAPAQVLGDRDDRPQVGVLDPPTSASRTISWIRSNEVSPERAFSRSRVEILA